MPVLTAIDLVNGNPLFSTPLPPQNRRPLIDREKFVVHIFYSCAKFGGNPSMGMGFWARWNITNFFIYTLFKQLTYRSDHIPHFHAWWLKWRGLTQGCAFLPLFDIAAHLWHQIAQTTNCGGMNRRFPAKCTKYWIVHIILLETIYCIDHNQILQSDRDECHLEK